MILKGDNQEIELKVTGYEYPHPTKSYWDNNWLMLYCGKKFGGYTAANRLACFLTVELKRLHCLLGEIEAFHKEASKGDIQLLKEFCMEALEQYPERNVGVR